MRNLSLAPLFRITLFGEGGGDGGTGAGAATGQTGAAPAQPQTQGVKGNPLADVRYGKQDVAPAAGEPATDARQAQFEALIKGEFKDLYDARVQETIKSRLKGQESKLARYDKVAGTFDLLGSKYGLDPKADDFADKLAEAIQEDESYYEDEALEKGLSVQQVKELRKMRRENEALKHEMEAQQSQQMAEQRLAEWQKQEASLKQIYPGFDLRTEIQNESFRQLMYNGIDMRTAFEVIHKDEILPAAMQYSAQQIAGKVANSVRSGKMRPAEGAMSGQSAVAIKSDVSQLTRKDRDEIDRRVARGERIRF